MRTGKINIGGREVNVAYCYATEIAFRRYTGENVNVLFPKEGKTPDPEHILYVILAAILAYYQAKGEEPPLKSESLMYEATPGELGEAFAEVMRLCGEWYQTPKGEPEEEDKEGDDSKNPLPPTTSTN